MPRYFSAISSPLRERLVGRIGPKFPAHALVHALGERFGEAVGQRLGHDRGIIVIGVLEALDDGFLADAGGHREGADIIGKAAGARRDEIGERDIGAAFAACELLTQRVQRRDRLAARLVGENENVVAVAVRRPESDDRAGAEPLLGDHLAQHVLRIGEQAPRRFADHLVVEDRRIFAVELPGGEERRPVDESTSSAIGISANFCVPRSRGTGGT